MAIDDSFVLIEGDWPCERAHRLLAALPAHWVIVHRMYQGEDLYYTFEHDWALESLPANSAEPVGVRLNLHETDAARTRPSYTGAAAKPTVIVSRGLVDGLVPPAGKVRAVRSSERDPMAPLPVVSRGIRATAPPQVLLGDTVSLVVALTGDAEVGTVPLMASAGESIDVVVQASGGIEINGRSDGELMIADSGSPSLLFKIAGRALGPGEATVLVFREGRGVGQIVVSIRVVQQITQPSPETATTGIEPMTARPPDLQLLILERRSPGGVTYEMRLSASDPALGLNLKPFGPFGLAQDPRSFFNDFYGDIEGILTSAANPREKMQRLESKGDYLFDQLVPPDARTLLWKLRSRIRSIHVQSEEPWIPWELIRLSGTDDTGAISAGGFITEEFEVTRWVPGLAYQCDLTFNEVGVVTPSDSGLPAALPERSAMLALAAPGRRVTPIDADEITLRQALASGTLDAIHFTGHGSATVTSADRAEIQLAQGSRLRPEDLVGEVGNLRRKHPLVFLNACEIGRAGMGLARPGGWPRGFLNAGAAAFIGPFWKVIDGSAARFAGAFYEGLLGGASVGKAALEARKQIQAASDPTWLAYSVYAHCDARMVTGT
jgi:hypothetical protein